MTLTELNALTVQEAAQVYISRGWQVVPLAAKSKACKDDDWLRLWRFAQEVGDADFPEIHFRDGSPQIIPMAQPGHQYEGVETIRWSPPNWKPNEKHELMMPENVAMPRPFHK